MLGNRHLGAHSLFKGNQHGVVQTSCDRGYDFRRLDVTRALNDSQGTESQSAHKVCVFITAPQSGPIRKKDNHDKDI
uniref:Uncharacterized protein n=1 Tax=Mesocestoides corti TaxID=53468 RepID=A0A5K3F358_MESCO